MGEQVAQTAQKNLRPPIPFRVDAATLEVARERSRREHQSLSAVVDAGLGAYAEGSLPSLNEVPDRLPDGLAEEIACLDAELGSTESRRLHPNLLNAYLAVLAEDGWPLRWIADAMPARAVSNGIRQRINSVRNDSGSAWPDVPNPSGMPLDASTSAELSRLVQEDRKAGTVYAAALVRAGWPLNEVVAALAAERVRPTKTRVHQRVQAGSPADPERKRAQGPDYVPRDQLPPSFPAPPEITSRVTRRGANKTTSFSVNAGVYAAAGEAARARGHKLPIVVEAILRDYVAAPE